ncbi:MAG: hypothetical protein HND40_10380 [Ignavibacteriota bacterium]|nr:MAG: hypothetical protein HND40_10380 [Ignavibacteriota bacterium]
MDYGVSTANQSTLEIDNLWVRGSMRIYELIINQIRATNGSFFVSSTAVVDNISVGTTGDVTITFDSDNNLCPFATGDYIMMQRFDIAGGILRKLVFRVGDVSGKSIQAFYVYQYASQYPIKGDVFVRIGSANTARQGSIYLTSDDSNSPFVDIKDGVANYTDWSDATKIKVRLGKLTGITDSNFGALSGYGLYATNAYLKGGIWATLGNIAGWTITSAQMSKTYTHPVTFEVDEVALNATSNDIGLHVWMDKDAVNVPAMLSIGAIKDYTNTISANEFGIQYQRGSDTYFRLTNSVQQIAGWNFNNTAIWKLGSGTPSSSPASGIVINSAGAITVYGNYWQKRVALYYSASNNWGLIGTNESYQTVFQLGSTNQIAGWAFDTSKIYNSGVRLEASASLKGLGVNDGATDVVKVGDFTNASESYTTSTMPNAPNPASAWTIEINVNNRLTWNSYGANYGMASSNTDFTSYQWRTYLTLPIKDIKGKTITISFGIAERESTNGSSKATNIWAYIKTDVGTFALMDVTPAGGIYLLGNTPTYETRTLTATIPSNATYARFYIAWYKNGAFDPADVLFNNWSFLIYNKTIVELNKTGLKIYNSPISKILLNNNEAVFNLPFVRASSGIQLGERWTLVVEPYLEGDGITLNERLTLKYNGVMKGFFSQTDGTYVHV